MTRPVKRQLRRAQIERREAARRARIEREALRRAQIELCVARYGKPTIEEIAAFEMEAAEVRRTLDSTGKACKKPRTE